MNVPRDVIHEFFSEIDGYQEATTDKQIDEVIGREYSEFNCSSILQEAEQFCLREECSVYRRNDDLQ
jgi:hypothetical protein